eukprot:TRINITY_DN6088_c0_g1_i4.p1 TRINITY_DN6088_c0_g1~~TRINITY_DN6088_c0_g1_i4.p1  ORF type:complete len:316 (+),score=69.67 TRINITY_DN6088_c0_g1_i4:155-1102(+)
MKLKNLALQSGLKLTAKSWLILNSKTGEILSSQQEHERREIASITKVMTAYTAIQIISNLHINVTESKIETPCEAAALKGTRAELSEGDVLSVLDMLHAMLLPSGNDAAYALAEYFGLVLLEVELKSQYKMVDPVQVFIYEMNKSAKALGMTESNFASPHGLKNCFNKSSAIDLAKLGMAAMKCELFANIVRKQAYECIGQDSYGCEKKFIWFNTNKLLTKGFSGLKTGITPSAGPCLLSSYVNEKVELMMILLSCKTPDHRWTETLKMKDWAVKALLNPKEQFLHSYQFYFAAKEEKSKRNKSIERKKEKRVSV